VDTHTPIINGIGKPFYRGGVPRFFNGGFERAQALRSFLMPTSDSKPAIAPRSHSGLVGTGVAATGGAGWMLDSL